MSNTAIFQAVTLSNSRLERTSVLQWADSHNLPLDRLENSCRGEGRGRGTEVEVKGRGFSYYCAGGAWCDQPSFIMSFLKENEIFYFNDNLVLYAFFKFIYSCLANFSKFFLLNF